MRAFGQLNSPTFKASTKNIANRSRSGTRGALNCRQSQSREGINSFRNSLGLKNYQEETKRKTEISQAVLHEDCYELRVMQCHISKAPAKFNKVLATKTMVPKQEQKQQMKTNVLWGSEQNTAETSKISIVNSTKLIINESEYFNRDYISPTFKIKALRKEKQIQKKRSEDNLLKIFKTQEAIQKNRSRYKREIQLYEKLIEKLKNQKKPEAWHQNITYLKKSGSMQTEAGESSNQL